MTARPDLTLDRPVVVGLGQAGAAVLHALVRRGATDAARITVIDDRPDEAKASAVRAAGAVFVGAPDVAELDALLATSSALLPSPGVPDGHPVFAAAAAHGVPVFGELDLVDAWDDRPLVVITGTDGKTTVTTMVTEMFLASGRRVVAAGNNELPLVEAIDDPDLELFVVEASSFRLGHAARFSPIVGTWLNFAPDHIDNHGSLERYEAAKAKLFELLAPGATAVVNADDPVVVRHAPTGASVVTFSLAPDASGFRVDDGVLRTAAGEMLAAVGDLPRSLPHDLANALAASATALAGGADLEAVRRVLHTFTGLPHRVQLVADRGGVRWYDDSKATTPHAAVTALRGFASAVLIAGGSEKGADLGVLAEAAPHVRAVVTLGVTGPKVAAAFAGIVPTHPATDMVEAVRIARDLAVPGDAVLLSPACASYDMFDNYAHRGDVFAAAVREVTADQEVPPA